MSRSISLRAPKIEEVRSSFEQWRQTRQDKAPIPYELWVAAVAVARRDGVNRTAASVAPGWEQTQRADGDGAFGFRENAAPGVC
jgi:hypothetical protein